MMSTTLKRELCKLFELPAEALEDITSWRDERMQCTVFAQGSTQVRVSDFAMQELSPIPDPFNEAFTVVALALHEARKR